MDEEELDGYLPDDDLDSENEDDDDLNASEPEDDIDAADAQDNLASFEDEADGGTRATGKRKVCDALTGIEMYANLNKRSEETETAGSNSDGAGLECDESGDVEGHDGDTDRLSGNGLMEAPAKRRRFEEKPKGN